MTYLINRGGLFRRRLIVNLQPLFAHPVLVLIEIDPLRLGIACFLGDDLQDLEILVADLLEPVARAAGQMYAAIRTNLAEELVADAVEPRRALQHHPDRVAAGVIMEIV